MVTGQIPWIKWPPTLIASKPSDSNATSVYPLTGKYSASAATSRIEPEGPFVYIINEPLDSRSVRVSGPYIIPTQ